MGRATAPAVLWLLSASSPAWGASPASVPLGQPRCIASQQRRAMRSDCAQVAPCMHGAPCSTGPQLLQRLQCMRY